MVPAPAMRLAHLCLWLISAYSVRVCSLSNSHPFLLALVVPVERKSVTAAPAYYWAAAPDVSSLRAPQRSGLLLSFCSVICVCHCKLPCVWDRQVHAETNGKMHEISLRPRALALDSSAQSQSVRCGERGRCMNLFAAILALQHCSDCPSCVLGR